jgi:restriction endonuclease S subunit
MIKSGTYETQPLGELCTKVSSGFTPPKNMYRTEGNCVIKVGSLSKNWKIKWPKIAFTTQEIFDKAAKAHVQDKDLLVLSASHQLDYIGKNFGLVTDIPDDYVDNCMAVGELIIIRANTDEVYPEYLLACFTLKAIQQLVNRMSRGQSAHLYSEDLKRLEIPKPDKPIQKEIIAILEDSRREAQGLMDFNAELIERSKLQVERLILGLDE